MSPAMSSPSLRMSLRRSGDAAVLRLAGELDCSTAPALDATLRDVFGDAPPSRLHVDMAGVTFVDVSGLDPLIRVARHVAAPGAVRLRHASRQLVRMLGLLQLTDVLALD